MGVFQVVHKGSQVLAAFQQRMGDHQPVLWVLVTTGQDAAYRSREYVTVPQRDFMAHILHSDPHNTLLCKSYVQALLTL